MYGNLAVTFYQNVVASYDAYTQERDSDKSGRYKHLRTALECATALFHFREHLPPARAMTWKQVYSACPEYRLIANIANTSKHKKLVKDDPIGPPLVSEVDELMEATIVVRYEDDEGAYVDARSVVVAKCSDGVERNVDEALTAVLNFWGARLVSWDEAKFTARPLPDPPGAKFVGRHDARAPSLEALRGLDFTQSFRMLEFDAAAGVARPVDLTDKKLEMRIYQPSYALALQLNHPEREPIELEFPLTPEESMRVHLAGTDEQREAVYRALAEERHAEIQARVEEALAPFGEGIKRRDPQVG